MKWKLLLSSAGLVYAAGLSSLNLKAHAHWQIPTDDPKVLQMQKQDVFAIDVSQNGEWFASSSFDGTTQVFKTKGWELLYNLPGHANWVGDVAFHPTEPVMVTAGLDGRLQIWDLKTGKKAETFETFEKALLSVRFSPDGKSLAVAGKSKVISLFDWKTRQLKTRFEGHSGSVVNLAFSPDGKYLASVAFDDLSILLWDLNTQQLAHRLVDHREELYAIDFSPDGKYLASAGADRIIRLWSMSTLLPIQQLAGHLKPVWTVRFHPDGKTLASGSVGDQSLRFWSVPEGVNTETLTEVGQNTYDLAFLPDGKTLMSSHPEGKVKRWRDLAPTRAEVNAMKTIAALRVDLEIKKASAEAIELTLKHNNVLDLEGVSVTVEVLTPGVELLSPVRVFFLPRMEKGQKKNLILHLQSEKVVSYIDLRLSVESQTPEGRVILPVRVPLQQE